MPKSQVSRFVCPNCDALYMVVRVRAPPSTFYRQITCRSCDGPLEAQKGRFILKYFLLEERRNVELAVNMSADVALSRLRRLPSSPR
jgi:hypothetical protein